MEDANKSKECGAQNTSQNSKMKFRKTIPAPVESFFYIEMIPETNTRSHSSGIDQEFKTLHTPITEMCPLDVLKELKTLEQDSRESWLRQGTLIDSVYYQEKSDRNELLMRDEQKNAIKDVLDYQKYLEETFEKVKEPLEDIIEEYPLLLGEPEYVLIGGETAEENSVFTISEGKTSLMEKFQTSHGAYNAMKLHIEDKLCVEIKDGKAIYSGINYFYRLSKDRN